MGATSRTLRFGGAGAAALVGLFLARPLDTARLVSVSCPATSYAEAIARVERLKAADGPDVNPLCATRLLTHGGPTDRAVVLFHGFADCAEQFGRFGSLLFDQGCNVLMPRAPRHGSADPMAEDLGRLTAAELAGLADEATDIAHGLGTRVTVVGLSMGGVMAGFVAQERTDVERAVLLAPAFVMGGIPPVVASRIAKALLVLPNSMRFFHDSDPVADPAYASPRYSTRGLAAILSLAIAVEQRARQTPVAARSVVVVTNAADTLVDNRVAGRVTAAWRRLAPGRISTYEFPEHLGLNHDLVDPVQRGQRIDTVYPVLLDLVHGP